MLCRLRDRPGQDEDGDSKTIGQREREAPGSPDDALDLVLLRASSSDRSKMVKRGRVHSRSEQARWTVSAGIRAALRAWFTGLRVRAHDTHTMLVVGTGCLARGFANRVDRRIGLGILVIGQILHAHVADEGAVCLEPGIVAGLPSSACR